MATTKEKLFSLTQKVRQGVKIPFKKVSIVGSGQVSASIAFTLLLKGISDQVVVVDKNEDRLQAEFQDMLSGSYFVKDCPNILASTDFSSVRNSHVFIFALDVIKIEGEIFLELIQRNIDVFKAIVPNVVQFCSDAIFIVVSSTCDILSYVCWKLSGVPKSNIIGIGTSTETAHFRTLIANKINCAPSQVQGSWIIGEQLKSFPIWSSVNFLSFNLHDVNENAGKIEGDHENWNQICKEMQKSQNRISKMKQNSTWATSLSCVDLVKAILGNINEIKTVSVMVKDHFGIDKEVFLSLPCAVNESGIGSFLNIKLNEVELKKFRNSANILDEIQKGINF